MIELNRFIEAQKGEMKKVFEELSAGKKTTHWMWFIFPQLKGLGHSFMSDYYGLNSVEDAKEYLKNPILRENMTKCVSIVSEYENTDELLDCFGDLDAKKLHSCLSLFYMATKSDLFEDPINKFFGGVLDDKTISLLKGEKL